MRLLIDGYTKETRSLAANIKYCKNLQIKVFDRSLEIDNMDLYLLQNLIKPEEETLIPNIDLNKDFIKTEDGKVVYTVEPVDFGNDSWIVSTTDAEEAMKWCDCYANFNEAEWQLITTQDYDSEAKYLKETLDRLDKAKSLGKKVYLPFRFGPYAEESKYDNMFNIRIDQNRLEHMRQLTNGTLLTENDIDFLSKYKDYIDIIISIDADIKDIYETIRVGANFDIVYENLKTLIEKGLLKTINCVVIKENESIVKDMNKRLLDLGLFNIHWLHTGKHDISMDKRNIL